MKRSFILMIALTVMLSSLLAACSGGSSPSGTESGSSDPKESSGEEPISLTLWRAGTDTLETEYWERVIQDYEADNPHINIELTSIPWGNEIETKLNAAFVSNTAPDVISFSIASVAARAELGHYAPLDDYVNNWDGKDDMIEKVLESGTYNGQIYGLGFIPDPRIFVWRKDYFREAGLDPDAPPTTWEELEEYARLLTVKEGGTTIRSGFQIRSEVDNGDAAQTWQTFALQNGAEIINTETDEALFASPKGIEAAEFLAGMAMDGVSILGKQDQDPFTTGRAAMSYANPNTVRSLINDQPELEGEIGYALPIEREQKATFAGLRLIFMGSQTDYPDEAWNFMEYIMSAEENWNRYEHMGVPVVRKSLQDQFIEDNPEINGAIFEGVTHGTGYPMVPYSFTFMEIISRALQYAYYGEKTAEEAFNEAKIEFERQLPDLKQ